MAYNWPPSTAPSSALHHEHMAIKPFKADEMDTAPALSQSYSPDTGFDGAEARANPNAAGITNPKADNWDGSALGHLLFVASDNNPGTFEGARLVDFAHLQAAEHAFSTWQDTNKPYAALLPNYTTLANPFLAPLTIGNNSYLIENSIQAPNPTIFDKPFDGRYLCSVLNCPKTFTRKADRDRHI
ncbi:hypothetical protein DL95DRAFT_419328 [Leptodontidium sp. 2 PMI_412]|nr:hypothetical protein DL95DRAFT_419328 [Leptodontidium sp. 2 PMI_412]